MPKFDLGRYLQEQSIRLRRNNWSTPKMLAEEMFSMFSGIQPTPVTTQAKAPPARNDPQPLVVPPITFPTFDPVELDLDMPESPVMPPPTFTPAEAEGFGETLPGMEPWGIESGMTGTAARKFYRRQSFPCQVLSNDGGDIRLRVWKNGPEGESSDPEDSDESGETGFDGIEVEARCIDRAFEPFVFPGDFTTVFMVAHYTEYLTVVDGRPEMTELSGDDQHTYYWLMGPTSYAGLGIISEDISAVDGTTPGEGEMTLRYFRRPAHERGQADSGDEGEWASGEDVTVYNSTSSEITSQGLLIQWKLINGLPFIDVEDCGGTPPESV